MNKEKYPTNMEESWVSKEKAYTDKTITTNFKRK